jgi:HD-like signal output (HDOD) protein
MPKHPVLMADKDTVAVIMREWHSSVAKAILENWEMSESLVSAVSVQDDPHYEHGGTADLGDVLVVANMMTAYHDHPDTLVLNMAGVKSFGMLGLDQANCAQVLADYREEIEALRQALGT